VITSKFHQKGGGGSNKIHGVMFEIKQGKPVGKEIVCYECGGNHYKGDPADLT
jgi:hypothetical protein